MATRFDNLLDEFGELPKRPKRQPTFLEIAGCAHRENACSDILAFFMNPARPHGLGTLFVDAILRIHCSESPEEVVAGNVSVDREVTTNAGNRIDLLIRSESHAILVENKICAPIGNPLHDYATYLDSLSQEHKYKFLLTLTPRSDGAEYGFRNITHMQLVKEIRGLLGENVARADVRYLTFMLDFLNTLDSLQEDRVVNQALLDLLKQRSDDVENFLNEIKGFKKALRKKTEELSNLLPDLSGRSVYPNVNQWFWGAHIWGGGDQESSLYDALGYYIKLASFESNKVVVSAHIDPSGWGIQIYLRNRKKGSHQAKLRNLLDKLKIPAAPAKEKEENTKFLHSKCFDFAESLDQIHPVVRDVVRKLATSDGAS